MQLSTLFIITVEFEIIFKKFSRCLNAPLTQYKAVPVYWLFSLFFLKYFSQTGPGCLNHYAPLTTHGSEGSPEKHISRARSLRFSFCTPAGVGATSVPNQKQKTEEVQMLGCVEVSAEYIRPVEPAYLLQIQELDLRNLWNSIFSAMNILLL